ncbi:SAM-dependent methyltransferase [uncultured Methanofollis sp.]|uniref:SAM-dependent methyltransferase n=1 Tax=uncultured Methanofollis sp. TaxID=262500 RepID=UPI002625C96A|nr:SAM-dependent methyltransferase [uncultured Methanofollis sp.]
MKQEAPPNRCGVVHHFHRAGGCELVRAPFLDEGKEQGIFAIRHYNRPNPIGLSIVRLEGVRGNVLDISGVDILDGTPLLDIKPYVSQFDRRENVLNGWMDERDVGGMRDRDATPRGLQGGKMGWI